MVLSFKELVKRQDETIAERDQQLKKLAGEKEVWLKLSFARMWFNLFFCSFNLNLTLFFLFKAEKEHYEAEISLLKEKVSQMEQLHKYAYICHKELF